MQLRIQLKVNTATSHKLHAASEYCLKLKAKANAAEAKRNTATSRKLHAASQYSLKQIPQNAQRLTPNATQSKP
jgi:hypothetical protein